jgi:hypothetical protein
MRLSLMLIVLPGIAAVGLTSSTLRAGSIAELNAGVIADQGPTLERVAHRRCWWRKGERHCRWVARKRQRVFQNRHGRSGAQEPNLPPNLGWGL